MTRTKVERAHNAVADYITPRLQHGASVDCRSFFTGIDDKNLAEHIPGIIGAIARATAGSLALDASEPELHKTLKTIADEPDGTRKTETPKSKETKGEIDQSIVDRILALLEHKLLPTELMAVRQLLTRKPDQSRPSNNDPEQVGEDARIALDYAARFPSAARIKIEPTCRAEPTRQTPPDVDGFASRFPNAMRIGQ